MSSPTVSVIMATYNHAEFVKQAIQSVLSQKGVDFEFLISDDGSSDQTREVIASLIDDRIQFFPNTINRGACVVTNELIERASGEFIALINSDDYWLDVDKLSYQIKILRDSPSIGACFGRARFVDEVGSNIDKDTLPFGNVFNQKNRSKGQWLRYFFDHGNCICHPTMLIRKSCYDELGGYDNRLRQLPDFDMWIRLIKKYDIFISDRELINFRIRPGENASSQTPTNSIRTINEHYLIAGSFFDGVTRSLFIDGFLDLLVVKDVPTVEHLDIEKALLFFIKNQWLEGPYRLTGLSNIYRFLNSSRHKPLLVSQYEIDDRWFQLKMGEINTLMPNLITNVKEKVQKAKTGLRGFIGILFKK